MSDAETLRRAAQLMRERAEAVSEWSRRNPERTGWPIAWFSPVFIANAFAGHAFGDSEDPTMREGWALDGEHISPWHPAAALAVADLLDICASVTEPDDDPDEEGLRQALAVAHAYLQETP